LFYPENHIDIVRHHGMFCPYCAAPLQELANGELKCGFSGALFSGRARSEFLQMAAARGQLESRQPHPGVRFFCACCSAKMSDGICESCGAVVDAKLAHHIIELNPHIGSAS
jgi:hypothetical protein